MKMHILLTQTFIEISQQVFNINDANDLNTITIVLCSLLDLQMKMSGTLSQYYEGKNQFQADPVIVGFLVDKGIDPS
jgi:hypothetical protein